MVALGEVGRETAQDPGQLLVFVEAGDGSELVLGQRSRADTITPASAWRVIACLVRELPFERAQVQAVEPGGKSSRHRMRPLQFARLDDLPPGLNSLYLRSFKWQFPDQNTL